MICQCASVLAVLVINLLPDTLLVYHAQLFVQVFVVNNRFPHKVPEVFPMIKFLQMAKFMHDQVILKHWRQVHDTVAEVQVALAGTASPFRSLVLDRNPAVGESVMLIEMFQSCMNKLSSLFLVRNIVAFRADDFRPSGLH